MRLMDGNYKKFEIINKYGYGIVLNVGKTLFTSFGYQNEIEKLINDFYNT